MTLTPERVMDALEPLYGRPIARPHGDGTAELVLTILSQNTADTNSGRAYNQLLQRFPSWDAIADAPPDEVVEAIRFGGLAQQKAPRIQAALRSVKERAPEWDLSFLRELPAGEARAWLRSLSGVGPKTAACVMLFALGMPAMPVDTHVERVSKRLGLVPASTSAERAHELLEAMVAPEDYYRFHMLLIKHGRRTCAARRPLCERCPLAIECPASLVRPAEEATPEGPERGRAHR